MELAVNLVRGRKCASMNITHHTSHILLLAPSTLGLLNLLHTKAASLGGDQPGRALMQRLLAAGCVPYFQVWTYVWAGDSRVTYRLAIS